MTDLSARLAGLSPDRRAVVERLRRGTVGGPAPTAEPIAVVGTGCRFPGGANDADSFWRILRDRVDATTAVPEERWDVDRRYDPDPDAPGGLYVRRGGFLAEPVDRFDAAFFGISAAEARSMDPQQRLLLEVSWEALENAGIAPDRLSGSQTGVFAGIGVNDYQMLQAGSERDITAYTATGTLFCVAAGRLSHVLGLRGPNMAIDTGCSSSLVAVHLACQSLRTGESDLALAGGVHLMLSPDLTLFFCRAHALAPDGRCKTFDADADGYVRGEGCGVVVLKRLRDAQADGDRVLAVIAGSAVNHDGKSSGLTVPSGPAQQALLRRALRSAGLRPADLSYVETHGAGTVLGDPIELQSLGAVLTEDPTVVGPVFVGALKTNIGHLEAAAGVAGLQKVILALQHEEIPANLNFATPNPRIPWDDLPLALPTGPTAWKRGQQPRTAGVSSFGIGGTNAHLIVQEPPRQDVAEDAPPRPELLVLSARSGSALRSLAAAYAERLRAKTAPPLADIAHTARVGRARFAERLAVVGDSAEIVADRLSRFAEGRAPAEVRHGHVGSGNRVAFVFTGPGAEYAGMGRELYATEPAFRAAFDRAATAIDTRLEHPLREVVFGEVADLPDEPAHAEPALFALGYALTELWRSWGVNPSAVLGYGVGELTAACVAGVLSVDAAAELVAERGRLLRRLPRDGAVTVVFADVVRVRAAVEPYVRELSVAAVNGPFEVVVSGAAKAVVALADVLRTQGIESGPVTAARAFHSSLADPVLDEFDTVVRRMAMGAPEIKLISTVTGAMVEAAQVADPRHWRDNLRGPVEFIDAAATLLADGCDVVIEMGPGPILGDMARRAGLQSPGGAGPAWLTSMRPGAGEQRALLAALAELHLLGIDTDPEATGSGRALRRCAAPTYPFERERYWQVATPAREAVPPVPDDATTGAYPGRWLRSPAVRDVVFETVFTASAPAFLPDHRVYGEVVVPGASHVAMLLAAAERSGQGGPCVVEDIRFTRALALLAEDRRPVQLVLREDGTWAVFSAPSPDAERWETHATGTFRRAVDMSVHPLDPVRRSAVEPGVEPGTELHRRMERAGYQLGRGFRWITELHRAADTLSAELVAPPDIAEHPPLHPALLDSCFQALLAAMPEALREDDAADVGIYVPAEVARLRFSGVTAGPAVRCVVTPAPGPWTSADPIRGDLCLIDGDGRRIVDLEGVVMRRVPAVALVGRGDAAQSSLIHVMDWPELTLPPGAPPIRGQRWQLHTSGGPLADALQRGLDDAGASVTRVAPGPAAEGPVGVEPPDAVVVLWGAEGPDTAAYDGDPGDLWAGEELLRLLPRLVAGRTTSPPRLHVVTRGTQQLRAGDPVRPIHSGLWGLTRVAAIEHPEMHPVLIDLQLGADPAGDAAAVLAVVGTNAGEGEIGYRDGRHYAARRSMRTVVDSRPALDPRGVYLITGGSGGLGTLFARHLAARGARSLVLLGRGAPSSDAVRAADELRASGVAVRHELVDVANRAALAAVLAEIRREGGSIRGVVHAAGVLDDGVLVQQTVERMRRVAAPKVAGAWNLHTLLAEDSLDLFVLFSSAAAFTGTAGQGIYAAANAFLDALAQHRRGLGLPASAIAWGPWGGIGLAANLNDTDLRRLADRGLGEISAEEGLTAFDQIVGAGLPYAGVFRATSASADHDEQRAPRPASLGEAVAPSTETEHALVALWETHFTFTPIGVSDHFFELGGDSILALRLVTSAWKLGLALEDTDLFSRPTIAELATILDARGGIGQN